MTAPAEQPVAVTHKCPRLGEAVTACCDKTPFELPRTDRLTAHAQLVTCPAWFQKEAPHG